MRRPLAPGTSIDAKRYKRWINHFGSYRAGIINVSIQSWLNQFDPSDQDLAARVLDAVEYYGQSQIHAAYRSALAALDGWHRTAAKRNGQWRFAAMSSSAGESGDAMLYQFRVANGLDAKPMNELFVPSLTDLFRQANLPDDDPRKLGKDDVVVLLDDFSGSGTQVCDAWNNPETSFGALLAGIGKVYLIVVAASKSARRHIADETDICLVPAHDCTKATISSQITVSILPKLIALGCFITARSRTRKSPRAFTTAGLWSCFSTARQTTQSLSCMQIIPSGLGSFLGMIDYLGRNSVMSFFCVWVVSTATILTTPPVE